MFLTVYLSDNEQHFTEVPVTPETMCRDVVDLCKEPGESECHLAEVWCGSGTRPGSGGCVDVAAGSAPVVRGETGDSPERQGAAFSLQLRCDVGRLPALVLPFSAVQRGRCLVKGQVAQRGKLLGLTWNMLREHFLCACTPLN